MARLGELLIAARLLDNEQIERALRAQVLWGGRLGTNLMELGLLDLDGISRALGRQHGVPSALERHFERANRELQEQIPGELARRWSVVPLLYVGPHKQIAVAVLDPLPDVAFAQLAVAFGCSADAILQSIAAEMRLRYHLERVYGIVRPTRFLRVRGPSATPFPHFDNVPVPIDSDAEHAVPIVVDESAHPTGRASADDIEIDVDTSGLTTGIADTAPVPVPAALEARRPARTEPPVLRPEEIDDISRLIDDATAAIMTVEPAERTTRDRRSYVRTLADDVAPAGASITSPIATLGRIAVKRVAQTPSGGAPIDPAPPAGKPASAKQPAPPTFLEAVRAIRRASNRDLVADLVVDALHSHVPTCEAALLLVIRGDIAISWKHVSRVGGSAIEIAVPLDQAGLLPAVIATNHLVRCGAAELTAIDAALMNRLGALHGDGDRDLVVAPIAIADRVMVLLAAATDAGAPDGQIQSIAGAAATAFARLIRDASR